MGKKTWDIAQIIDMVRLHTLVGWKERRRTIKPEFEEKPFLEDENWSPGRISKFYAFWMTDPMDIKLNEDGTIPKNSYGNVEIMYGIPPGTKHVPIKGMKRACKSLGIDFAESVVDF